MNVYTSMWLCVHTYMCVYVYTYTHTHKGHIGLVVMIANHHYG